MYVSNSGDQLITRAKRTEAWFQSQLLEKLQLKSSETALGVHVASLAQHSDAPV